MATILIVDDEPDIRLLVKVNLEADGHRVVDAGDGADALSAVREEPPDLVVLDLMMPEVDGWAFLQQLKAEADRHLREIPVLMLTAYGGSDNEVRAGIEGALRFLPKPFDPGTLRREVADALAGDPEPVQRLRAQRAALERLARSQKGGAPDNSEAVRPHLTRFERQRGATEPRRVREARARLAELTERQRDLLLAIARSPSVSDAAVGLGVSRSNVYASLRRISRKLDVPSVPDLLSLVRTGALFGSGDPRR